MRLCALCRWKVQAGGEPGHISVHTDVPTAGDAVWCRTANASEATRDRLRPTRLKVEVQVLSGTPSVVIPRAFRMRFSVRV